MCESGGCSDGFVEVDDAPRSAVESPGEGGTTPDYSCRQFGLWQLVKRLL